MTNEALNQLFKAIGALESKVDTLMEIAQRDSERIDKIESTHQGLRGGLWTLSAILGTLNFVYIAAQMKGLL